MQKIADGEPWKMPATIEDPAALDEITGGLKTAGYALKGTSRSTASYLPTIIFIYSHL